MCRGRSSHCKRMVRNPAKREQWLVFFVVLFHFLNQSGYSGTFTDPIHATRNEGEESDHRSSHTNPVDKHLILPAIAARDPQGTRSDGSLKSSGNGLSDGV